MNKHLYSHKQIRKTIKKDELRDFITRAAAFVKGNMENVLITAVIVGVIAVLVPLYFSHRADSERRAVNLLNRGLNYYMQPIAKNSQPGGEAFRTAEEKYKKAQEAFAEVADVYRNTKAAALAKMEQANAFFFLKNYDKAKALYQEALARDPKSPLAPTLQQRLAAIEENQGRWQEALDQYQALLAGYADYYNRPACELAIARCQRQLGKAQEADAALQKLAESQKDGYWGQVARQELILARQSAK